jgi:lysophospholipid acyltransferase (LPLAT)-like uncharacterized protein
MSDPLTESNQFFPEEQPDGAPGKPLHYEDAPRVWTRWQRLQIWLAAHVGYWLIAVVDRTLRYESRGDENLEAIYRSGHRAIFTFWHNRIFAGTWYFRRRGIVVMTSQNFDGEYIARFIQMHGYGAARGSSSRGGLKALLEMAQLLKQGVDVGFTVDGPRGPLYQAKIGPVLLARDTAAAIFCFHVSCEKKWVIRGSWDQFQIPKPFSRVLVIKAPAIYVRPDADKAEVQRKHAEMQKLLETIRDEGDAYWESDSGQ